MSMSDDDLKQFNEQLAEGARLQADSNRMQALQLEVLTKLAQAQGINVDSINKSKNAFDGLKGSTSKQSAAAESNAHSLKVMDDAMANFNKTLTNTTASAVSFGKALLSNEQGFAKYNQALSSAGDAAMSLGKNFGIFGFALGGAIKGLTMAAEQFTKQADSTLKATDDFSKMGAAGSFTAKEVLKMGHDAGLTSKNIEYLTKATKTLGTATLSLGSTAGEGIAEFAKMTAVSSETRQAFQRLGIGQEELIQSQADFVSLQKASGVQITARMKQDGSLQKASLEYTKNLLELAAITGEDVEGAKKLQLEAQSELETKIQTNMMQQRINELQKQGGAQAEAQAAALQKELDARNAVLAVATSTKDAELKSATASFLATGAITEQSVMLKRLIPNIEEFGEKIKKGQDVSAEFAEALQKGTDANARSVGTAGMLDKTVAKTFGLTDGLLTWSAQRRDVDIKAAKDKAGKDIGKPEDGKTGAKTEQDPAQIARNELTEAEIKAKVKIDELVAEFNPLLKGFNATTLAAGALMLAATAAALALGKMAASAAMNKMGGGGGKGDGGFDPKTPPKEGHYKDAKGRWRDSSGKYSKGPPSELKGASKGLGKVASVAGKFAGPAAGLIAAGAGVMTAYEGAKDVDEKVKKGELTKDEGTVKKSEAVGAGVGQAAVGAAGAWGGAAAGAAIGSVVPVVGTVIGGLLGAAVGGWLGSKGGEIVGENVGKTVGKSMVDKSKVDASGRATAATDPRLAGATQTAATDPKVGNAIMKEEQESLSKGLANMVKEDQERAKQAKEDAQKLTKASETQEVSFTTLNRTLLATNTALINLTSSINNLTKPGGMAGGSMASLASKASGGGISVPGGIPTSFKTSGGGSAMSVGMPGDMPKTSKPTSQPAEGSENGTGSASKTVDLGKIMKFGTGSGTQQNFESLQSTFKDAVTAAAMEYNSVTGNKLTINSAKRDPEDQQRLWDESVAAGRPGKGPTGMAIGKPGRSLHEKGEAVDIQNYKDPDAVAAMNKQGLTQKVPGDPVHFQANLGGILDGPTSGYPVEGTMHGREAIIPLNPDSIITKLLTTSEAQIKQEMNNTVTTNTSTSDTTSQIMADLYSMMEEKFDAMIDALEDGNDHTEKLVKFSAV